MNQFDKFDILSVSERAFKKIKEGQYVVNGSSGTLYYENGEIVSYKETNDYLINNFTSFLSYASQLGPKEYRDGYLSWIFEDELNSLKQNKNISICATSGGTEALFMAFKSLNKTHTVLFSSIRWPNYDTISKESDIKFEIFNFFNKDFKFDFVSLENRINEIDSKILLVINDPCHNPTGFNLEMEDYNKLFALINKYNDKVTLLLDLAYLDYSSSRKMIIKKIVDSSLKTPLYLAVSASKSFGFYGLRMGALITIFNKNEEDIYTEKYKTFIRGTISSTNHLANGGLGLFFKDEEAVKKVKRDIFNQSERISRIGNGVKEILKEKNIQYYPYSSGFYITFIKEDAPSYLEYLESKNIYFTLIDNTTIRIAICSLKESDLTYLKENL